MKYKFKYLAEAADDGAVDGGGGDEGDTVKRTIDKERQRARDAEKAYKELKSQFADVDIEEYKALREAAGKQKKTETETITKQQKQIEALTQQLTTYRQRYEDLVVGSEISAAFNEMGGKASTANSIGYQKIVEKIVRDQVRYDVDEDGNGRLIVLDERGGERVDSKGRVVTLKGLIGQLREDDALSYCFNPDNPNAGNGGLGSPNNRVSSNRSGKSAAQLQREIINDPTLTPEQKLARAAEYGLK